MIACPHTSRGSRSFYHEVLRACKSRVRQCCLVICGVEGFSSVRLVFKDRLRC